MSLNNNNNNSQQAHDSNSNISIASNISSTNSANSSEQSSTENESLKFFPWVAPLLAVGPLGTRGLVFSVGGGTSRLSHLGVRNVNAPVIEANKLIIYGELDQEQAGKDNDESKENTES